MTEKAGTAHIVQFYEQDAFLIGKASEFLIAGFESGEAAIVIATPEHRQGLVRFLSEAGWRPEGLEMKGRLFLLDARETLDHILSGEGPDDDRFRETAESILERASHPGKPARAFSEMEALLRAERKEDAAVRLEEAWVKLLSRTSLSLLCAYPVRDPGGSVGPRPFPGHCGRHVRFAPSESFSSAGLTGEERDRAVAGLQQKADALERRNRGQESILEALGRTAARLAAERDPEAILRTAAEGGREIAGAAFGAFLPNRAGGLEASLAARPFFSPREPARGFPSPREASLVAAVLAGEGPIRIEDFAIEAGTGRPAGGNPSLPGDPEAPRSYLAVPIVARGGAVLGGLFFGHPEPGRFAGPAEGILAGLAAQAALALENAEINAALQRQIAQSRERETAARHFAAIVASSNDAIVSKDLNSIVLSWNKSAERIFGYTAEEMIGTSIMRLIPENHLDEEPEILRRIASGQTISHYETIRRRKDGTLINISLTVSPIKDEQGRIVGASKVARDITDLKTAEAQLRQAQKMEAVGRLAGGVAHDFNNLLTSIIGFVDMAMAGVQSGSEMAEYLDEVRKAGLRASTLTQQLLAYSRKQVLSPKVMDLNESVSDMDKMLRRLLGEDLEFRTRLDPDLARIKADPGQIQQVIMNLALNARDAMPEGGILSVETENAYLDREYVSGHPEATVGPHVRLTVSDTGVGMPPEVLAHIFEPFFTTKEIGKGTGLGLSSVYGIVKQSGGSIAVTSRPAAGPNGRSGTIFRLHFPAVDRKGDVLRANSGRIGENAAPTGETILLAEDEAAVRRFLLAALKSHGYRVFEARDGAEALAIALKLERIDLVLTDVVMPNLGGDRLAAEIKAGHPEAKILFMSGYTKDTESLRGLSRRAAFIQKPFTQADILAKVRETLSAPALA